MEMIHENDPFDRVPSREPDQPRMARATGKMAIAYEFKVGLGQADEVRKILASFLRDEASDIRVIASVASATTLVVVVEDRRDWETRTKTAAEQLKEQYGIADSDDPVAELAGRNKDSRDE